MDTGSTHFIGTRMLAEWEKQKKIQLTWPHRSTDWCYMLEDITTTFVEISDAITKYEDLLVVGEEIDIAKDKLRNALDSEQYSRITFFECPNNDTWARDHGFISIMDNNSADIRLQDFQFNGWGQKFPSEKDNSINKILFDNDLVKGTYESHLDFVLEGGSIESDGEDTVFTTEPCLLAPHRNQPRKKEEIEEYLKTALGCKRVIWLQHGNLEGDDTDGHIDTLARICPNDTITYTKCDDKNDSQWKELNLMEEELKELKTLDGQKYKLVPLPCPSAIYDEDNLRLPATYANYLVINGAVLVPTYDQPSDIIACNQIKKIYPDRDIIPIDSRNIIQQHGSIHCLTMQYY